VRDRREDRSMEANTLRADLVHGRLMEQAVHQAKQAYQFCPNTYSFECLNATVRLRQRLKELVHLERGESAKCNPPTSPQQQDLLDDRCNPE
jgi:hypothetical protein